MSFKDFVMVSQELYVKGFHFLLQCIEIKFTNYQTKKAEKLKAFIKINHSYIFLTV